MTDTSPVLDLPYLQPSQAQKHVTHNEALRRLDLVVQLRVQAVGAETPPDTPAEGEVHALGAQPVAAWAGQAGRLAAWIDGGWLFFEPQPGWRAWDIGAERLRVWDGTAWVLPQAESRNLDGLGIGTEWDATNRLAVQAAATLLSHAGAGHQLKVNKAAPGDTAALLFQSGWTGHAEMGLAGDTAFSIKVSPDGGNWTTALGFDPATGLAQGAAVQSGWIDSAAGKLLKAGAFGWGHDAAQGSANGWSGQSLSGITVTGVYRYSSTHLDAPGAAGVLLHFNRIPSSTSGGMMQMAISNTGTIYTRVQNGVSPTTFSAWETVLSEGSFGLGGSAVQLAGTDSLQARQLQTGFYQYMANAVAGGPESASWSHTLQVVVDPGTNRRLFISARLTTSAPFRKIWIGMNSGTDAIAWSPLPVFDHLVGAVSQSGGVPTGAIIERGSNANGQYVRFADGTQICSRNDLALTYVDGSSVAGTWTFPASFITTPATSHGVRSHGSLTPTPLEIGTTKAASSQSSCVFTLYRISGMTSFGVSDSSTVSVTAVGRWF